MIKKFDINKNIQQYKNKTGYKRLPNGKKSVLNHIKEKYVRRTEAKPPTEKQINNRIKKFNDTYNADASEFGDSFNYMTAAEVAKENDIDKKEEAVDLHSLSITYNELPEVIKRWSHKSDNFLYNNQFYFGDDKYFDELEDGIDHTAYDFLRIVIPLNFPDYEFDPEKTGKLVIYLK